MVTLAAIVLNVELNLYRPMDDVRARTLCQSYLQTAITKVVRATGLRRQELMAKREEFYLVLQAAQRKHILKVKCNYLPPPKEGVI